MDRLFGRGAFVRVISRGILLIYPCVVPILQMRLLEHCAADNYDPSVEWDAKRSDYLVQKVEFQLTEWIIDYK